MVIGLLTMQIHMKGINSLKEKRCIVKSLIGRLKSRFNVSVSEVDSQDSRSRAGIGIALVSNDSRFVHQQLDAIISFSRADSRFTLGCIERELFS
ncbi:MAG: DUF503 domain-containing protein [Planctomycetota bacterium]